MKLSEKYASWAGFMVLLFIIFIIQAIWSKDVIIFLKNFITSIVFFLIGSCCAECSKKEEKNGN